MVYIMSGGGSSEYAIGGGGGEKRQSGGVAVPFFLVSSREFLVWKALRPRDQSCIGSMFRIRSRFLLYLRHSVNSAREGLLRGELVLARLSRSF